MDGRSSLGKGQVGHYDVGSKVGVVRPFRLLGGRVGWVSDGSCQVSTHHLKSTSKEGERHIYERSECKRCRAG